MTDRSVSDQLSDAADDPSWTRRGFLLSAAVLASVPVLIAADPAVAAEELPDFPADVALYRSAYRNWVGEITADGLWAYTAEAVWSDAEVLDTAIPASFGESTWGQAAGTLDRLDPHRVLGNAFLDRLLR